MPPVDSQTRRCPDCGCATYRIRSPWYLRVLRPLFRRYLGTRLCPACGWSGIRLSRRVPRSRPAVDRRRRPARLPLRPLLAPDLDKRFNPVEPAPVELGFGAEFSTPPQFVLDVTARAQAEPKPGPQLERRSSGVLRRGQGSKSVEPPQVA